MTNTLNHSHLRLPSTFLLHSQVSSLPYCCPPQLLFHTAAAGLLTAQGIFPLLFTPLPIWISWSSSCHIGSLVFASPLTPLHPSHFLDKLCTHWLLFRFFFKLSDWLIWFDFEKEFYSVTAEAGLGRILPASVSQVSGLQACHRTWSAPLQLAFPHFLPLWHHSGPAIILAIQLYEECLHNFFLSLLPFDHNVKKCTAFEKQKPWACNRPLLDGRCLQSVKRAIDS